MQLFYYCEGDPDLLTANYAPPEVMLPPNNVRLQPDVLATFCSRAEQYIFLDDGSERSGVIRSATGSDDMRFRHITVGDLESSFMRIKNWQEVIAACHRTTGWNLAPQRRAIIDLVTNGRVMTVESIIRKLRGDSTALVLGAIAQLLRERQLNGDLDSRPWTWMTAINRQGVRA